MKNDFKNGDIVKHRSGKRKMVVIQDDDTSIYEGRVCCRWEAEGGFETCWLHPYELQKERKL